MAKELPDSMDELVYFSRRKFTPEKGKATAWVRRKQCPSCEKGLMSKPIDEKTGKFKVRAKEYVCPECGHAEEKGEHEKTLTAEITYTCPFCGHEDEAQASFARKSFYGKKAIVFNCAECKEKLGVTKKLTMPPQFLAKIAGKDVKEIESDDDDDDF